MRPRSAAAHAVPLAGAAGQGAPRRDWTASGRSGAGAMASDVADGPGRPATEAEAVAIAGAILDSPLVSAASAEDLRITGIRTSTGAPDWAFAVLRPLGGTDPSIAVLRWDTCCGWVLDQVGIVRFTRGAGGGGPAVRGAELSVAGAPGIRRHEAGSRRGCESPARSGGAARPG
ncbi:conserved hypothetical protein [Frankia canadensis]|uniref:Uncharacterized protein n=1 Tax=Frankia canadensis TaxID=1836972 RepID=A0A2I2KPE9_9ACTN|nr:hypothetical protein [Frankia canadensis]SNQ47545.1 conserved hypothetical protein [Frankia canadensis]SOU54835.1 conserved hypothetical protein [Frankia canadensis]